jgi:hypothetical protein
VVRFTPRPLYPRERIPGTHWTGDWVGPRAGLDTAATKIKIPCPNGEPNSGHPPRSLVTILTELSRLLCFQGNVRAVNHG